MDARTTIGAVCSAGVGPAHGGRERNEDNYLVCRAGEARFRTSDGERVERADGSGVLVAVADGMGGHAQGDLASGAAVRALVRLWRSPPPADPEDALRDFLLESHARLRERALQSGPVNLGTTLTAAWVLGARAVWAHVGDSRLYLLRGRSLSRLTRDHTRGEFARRDRRPPPPGADKLAQGFLYGSRGLGDDAAIRIDRGTDTGTVDLSPGDRLLLCSDGLTKVVEDPWLVDAMAEAPEPAAVAMWLSERAMAAGSDDNITVLVVRIDEVPDAAVAPIPDDPTDDALVPPEE